MARRSAQAAVVACGVLAVCRASGEPSIAGPCEAPPARVAAIASGAHPEAFGLDASGSVIVVSVPGGGQPVRSIIRIAAGEAAPKEVPLPGRVAGLAVSADGGVAFAILRTQDKKGGVRSVDLVRVDLKGGRAATTVPLPATAAGIAFMQDESGLLVACRDEIRTFRLPQLASGPLYRVPGENVGVAPLPGSSRVLVAQRDRLVVADLAEIQDRSGLPLIEQQTMSEPLQGAMASGGPGGPVLVTESGSMLCASLDAIPQPEPARSTKPAPVVDAAVAAAAQNGADQPPEPRSAPPEAAPAGEPTATPPPEPSLATPEPAVAPTHGEEPPQQPLPPSATVVPTPVSVPPDGAPEPASSPMPRGDAAPTPGQVTGSLAGPARSAADVVVFLGPDNILREARRVAPDAGGRFLASGLPDGSYRVMAAGRGGRVLICNPPFVTIHVQTGSTVVAPVIEVLRAP